MLDGIEFRPKKTMAVVVHVHGSLGNFYHQPFLKEFARVWTKRGIALISYNLRAHDGIAEGYDDEGEMDYVGGSITDFQTCVEDVHAMVQRGRKISHNVYLQGHSMGCDRVVHYKIQRSSRIPIILLSPCNSKRLQERWLRGETVRRQVARLRADLQMAKDGELTLLTEEEYGIRAPQGWIYAIPINRSTLLSIMQGPVFKLFDVRTKPTLVDTEAAWVYLGENDPIRGCHLASMERHICRMFPGATCRREAGGGHGLEECTESVTGALSDWILRTAESGSQCLEVRDD